MYNDTIRNLFCKLRTVLSEWALMLTASQLVHQTAEHLYSPLILNSLNQCITEEQLVQCEKQDTKCDRNERH